VGIQSALIRALPPGLFTYVAGLQHRNPALRPLARRLGGVLRDRSGRIPRGLAAGLRIDCGSSVLGYLTGTVEPQIQRLLPFVVRRGDTVYDVGANVGFYTLALARLVGPTGTVLAFEPLSTNAATLRGNIACNRFSNVEVLQVAISDHVGQEHLLLGSGSTGARLAPPARSAVGAASELVEVVSLDHVCASGRAPAARLIKMDIEGGETAALRGMRNVLARDRPLILCEMHSTHTDVASILSQSGYSCFCVEDAGLTLREIHQMHWNAHILAFPSERAGDVDGLRGRWAKVSAA
jgi:FkbM family methyltransferase